MKSVLVTGDQGFKGKWLVPKLDCEVRTLDEKNSKSVTNWEDIKDFKVDTVFHLAAVSFIPEATKNPHKAFTVNSFGTLNILELCRLNDARIVFPSSYMYGQPKYTPVDEEHPIKLMNTYARSKYVAEQLINHYHEEYGIKFTILRFFNIYGPGQDEQFLIPRIISQLKTGRIVLKDPEPKRDFTYIADAIDAYIKAARYKKSGIFNIGSGKSYSVREVVDKIIKGKDIRVEYTNEKRKNEIMDSVANCDKAKRELKWSPKIDIDTGLKMMQNG